MQKLQKAKGDPHPRERRSSRHKHWKVAISEGMRRAAKRRRAAGLVTFAEAAIRTLYPVGALKRMAATGELKILRRGVRCYIPASEIRRLRRAA
jgi:hypothetical protein